jgi:methyl-accepting chemotaxis protein
MAGFVIVLALVALSLLLSHFRNTRVIDSIRKELDSIISNINAGKGDLTARINTKTETEVKAIKDGLNDFIETLQNIIRDVKEGTVVLKTSSEEMTAQIRKASDNVTNSSAALEELSASMDNVATTAAGINDRLVDVKEAVDTINDAAEEGNETARSIKTEAAEIKSEAEEKKANTGAKMEELSSVLEQSVRDSEKVKQINDLTNDILDIASQTNLLALNASIEAARAGEAGKGFAVVADEISSLAANSRETANTIQEISKEVTAAVNTLSKNAQEVLEFINTTVLADYDAFVETGDKYENTSAVIDQMIEKFSERADHLREIMDEMVENVNAITQSVEQSTQAISMSATNSTEIVEEISEIDIAMGKNNDVTEQLNSSADKFEIV